MKKTLSSLSALIILFSNINPAFSINSANYSTPLTEYCNKAEMSFNKFNKKGFEEALKNYDKALEIDRNYHPAVLGKAKTLNMISIYLFKKSDRSRQSEVENDALTNSVIATKLAENSSESYKTLATVYLFRNMKTKAKEFAQKAIALDKTDGEAYLILALSEMDDDKFDPNNPSVITAINFASDSPFLHFLLSFAYMGKRDFSKSAESFEKLLKLTPDNELALTFLAYIYDSYFFRTEEARLMLEKALMIDDENARANFILGKIHFNRFNVSKAFEHIKKSCKSDAKYACDWLKSHGSNDH